MRAALKEEAESESEWPNPRTVSKAALEKPLRDGVESV